jgi:hypothetical protein
MSFSAPTPPGTPFKAHPWRPGGHARPYPQQRRGPGIQSRRLGWIMPEPGLAFEAFVLIASLRRISWNLTV